MYFIIPFQRLLSQFNTDSLFVPIELTKDLSETHVKDDIQPILKNDLLLFRLAIHQESEFEIVSKNDLVGENVASASNNNNNNVYYSKSNLDYLFQIYVFDEFISQLDSFEVLIVIYNSLF
jgi:hypothetical protein